MKNRILMYRKGSELTQVEMGQLLGISQAAISRIERGLDVKLSLETLRRFELLEAMYVEKDEWTNSIPQGRGPKPPGPPYWGAGADDPEPSNRLADCQGLLAEPQEVEVPTDLPADIVVVNGLMLARFEGEDDLHRRFRDTDIAKQLDYERPREIRHLIKRYLKELSNLGEVSQRPMVKRWRLSGNNQKEVVVDEFWLNYEQTLFVIMKSETPGANELTVRVVQAFKVMLEQRRQSFDSSGIVRAIEASQQSMLEVVAGQKDMMATHQEILTGQQGLLANQQDLLASQQAMMGTLTEILARRPGPQLPRAHVIQGAPVTPRAAKPRSATAQLAEERAKIKLAQMAAQKAAWEEFVAQHPGLDPLVIKQKYDERCNLRESLKGVRV